MPGNDREDLAREISASVLEAGRAEVVDVLASAIVTLLFKELAPSRRGLTLTRSEGSRV